jgi:hypothetical protein
MPSVAERTGYLERESQLRNAGGIPVTGAPQRLLRGRGCERNSNSKPTPTAYFRSTSAHAAPTHFSAHICSDCRRPQPEPDGGEPNQPCSREAERASVATWPIAASATVLTRLAMGRRRLDHRPGLAAARNPAGSDRAGRVGGAEVPASAWVGYCRASDLGASRQLR